MRRSERPGKAWSALDEGALRSGFARKNKAAPEGAAKFGR